jgi:hypothetical protein
MTRRHVWPANLHRILPLLIERLNANCRAVTRQSTRTMASAPLGTSGVAAKRERPERGWS